MPNMLKENRARVKHTVYLSFSLVLQVFCIIKVCILLNELLAYYIQEHIKKDHLPWPSRIYPKNVRSVLDFINVKYYSNKIKDKNNDYFSIYRKPI